MLQILLGKNKVFVTIADKIRDNRVSAAALNTSILPNVGWKTGLVYSQLL